MKCRPGGSVCQGTKQNLTEVPTGSMHGVAGICKGVKAEEAHSSCRLREEGPLSCRPEGGLVGVMPGGTAGKAFHAEEMV